MICFISNNKSEETINLSEFKTISNLTAQIERMIDKGSIREVRKKLKEVSNSNLKGKKFLIKFFESQILQVKNEFSSSLLILENLKSKTSFYKHNSTFLIKVELLKANALINLNRLKEAEKILVKIERSIKNDTSISSIEKDRLSMQYFLRQGEFWRKKNKLDKAMQCFETGQKLSVKLSDQKMRALFFYSYGSVELQIGRLREAERNLSKSYNLYKNTFMSLGFPIIAYNYGIALLKQGKLMQATRFLRESLSVAKDIEDHVIAAFSTNSLGSIAFIQGKLDDARERYYEAVQEIEKTDRKILRYHFFYNIALVYKEKASLDEAIAWFSQALKIIRHSVRPFDYEAATLIHYSMASLFIELGDRNRAMKEIEQIVHFAHKTENKIIQLRKKLIKAILLKNSSDLKGKVKAYEIFENITASPNADHAIKQEAVIQLCGLLMFEAMSLQNPEALEKLQYWIQILQELGKKQKDAWAFLASLRIQALLDVFKDQREKAIEKLAVAIKFADENGMFHWATIIANDRDNLMLNRSEGTKPILAHQDSNKGWSSIVTANQLLVKTPPYEVLTSEKPLHFLVIIPQKNGTGIIVVSPKGQICEEEYISDLVAILINKTDFREFQGFYHFVLRNNPTLIDKRDNLYYAYVYEGNSYLASQKLDFLIGIFHEQNYHLILQVARDKRYIWKLQEKAEETLDQFIPVEVENSRSDRDKSRLTIKVIFRSMDHSANMQKNNITNLKKRDSRDGGVINNEIKELLRKKKLIHPVKLTILRFLYKNFRLNASDLRELLGIPWGNFATHYMVLINEGLIETKTEFVEAQPRTVFYITDKGVHEYKRLKDILKRAIS